MMLYQRPKFTKSTKQQVVDKHRNVDGHIVCDHCKQVFDEDHTVTFHHVKPWRDVSEELLEESISKGLSAHQFEQSLKPAFDDVKNLVPLHEACHREIDDGVIIPSDWHREQINSQSNGAKPKDFEPLDTLPIRRSKRKAEENLAKQRKKARSKHKSETIAVKGPPPEFSFKRTKTRLEQASLEQLSEKKAEAEKDLEEITDKIDNFTTPSTVVGQVRVNAGKKLDKLINHKHSIYTRLDRIDAALLKAQQKQR